MENGVNLSEIGGVDWVRQGIKSCGQVDFVAFPSGKSRHHESHEVAAHTILGI